jgi:hypothetical protein
MEPTPNKVILSPEQNAIREANIKLREKQEQQDKADKIQRKLQMRFQMKREAMSSSSLDAKPLPSTALSPEQNAIRDANIKLRQEQEQRDKADKIQRRLQMKLQMKREAIISSALKVKPVDNSSTTSTSLETKPLAVSTSVVKKPDVTIQKIDVPFDRHVFHRALDDVSLYGHDCGPPRRLKKEMLDAYVYNKGMCLENFSDNTIKEFYREYESYKNADRSKLTREQSLLQTLLDDKWFC